MKLHANRWILCCLGACFFLCVHLIKAEETETKNPAPARNEQTSPGRHPPPPPIGERKHPFATQFNVRARVHALLEQLRKNEPEEYERLLKLRSENRQEYLKELWEKMPEQKNEQRKKISEIDRHCWELGDKFNKASSEEEKNAAKKELSALLEQSLELVIQDTRERLERIQKILDNLNENREKILQQRLDDFLTGKNSASQK